MGSEAFDRSDLHGRIRSLGYTTNNQTAEIVDLVLSLSTPSAVAAEAGQVPEIDYERLVADAWANHKYRCGTSQCIAFKLGAEWFRHQLATQPAPPSQGQWHSADRMLTQTIEERDTYREWADKLAHAIAAHVSVYIGEHSNVNSPWLNALDAIREADPPANAAEDMVRIDWLQEQAKASRTGASLSYARHVEDGQVLEQGYRFMRWHFATDFKRDIRSAIDAARAAPTQPPAEGGAE